MAVPETIQPVFDLEEILFPVEQIPSADLFPGFEFVRDKERAIWIPGRKKVLHLCSEGYRLISNREILEPIRDALLTRYGAKDIDVRIFHFDDRKFYVSFIIKAISVEFEAGDLGHPSLEIWNSYDGSLRFSLMKCYFRLRGATKLMAFSTPMPGIKKHSNRYSPRFSEKALGLLEQADPDLTLFDKLVNRNMDSGEITELASLVERKTSFPKRLVREAAHRVYNEAEAFAAPLSAWRFYCGFNYVLNVAPIRMHPEFRVRVDEALIKMIQSWSSDV